MGIGKKEKKDKGGAPDEDIGEKITFTADGEGHSLWIEDAGGGVAVMVKSATQTVESLLTKFEGMAAKIPDEEKEKKEKTESLITEARQALQKVEAEGSEAKTSKSQAKA